MVGFENKSIRHVEFSRSRGTYRPRGLPLAPVEYRGFQRRDETLHELSRRVRQHVRVLGGGISRQEQTGLVSRRGCHFFFNPDSDSSDRRSLTR